MARGYAAHRDAGDLRIWYGGRCGPYALAAIVGDMEQEEATSFLLDVHALMGLDQADGGGGCSWVAMERALLKVGYRVDERVRPILPREEWTDQQAPQNFGYGWGGTTEYLETRPTLARFVREGEGSEGLWLITVGSSAPHYVVYRDGNLVEDSGVPMRRGRVLMAWKLEEVDHA